jgi:hypothetical protein
MARTKQTMRAWTAERERAARMAGAGELKRKREEEEKGEEKETETEEERREKRRKMVETMDSVMVVVREVWRGGRKKVYLIPVIEMGIGAQEELEDREEWATGAELRLGGRGQWWEEVEVRLRKEYREKYGDEFGEDGDGGGVGEWEKWEIGKKGVGVGMGMDSGDVRVVKVIQLDVRVEL